MPKLKNCGKFPYVSKGEARSLIGYKTGNEIYGKPYRCKTCNFWPEVWHLGHKAPKKSKVAIRRKELYRRYVALNACDELKNWELCELIDKICGVKSK